MASSALAKMHHLPPWLLTIMILTLFLSLSSSLAAEFTNFGKFPRTNHDQQTGQPTVKTQDSIADLSKAKTLTETDLDGANTQHPFPKDREEQFRIWNSHQFEKQQLKAAKTSSKTSSETSFPDSLDELNKNYKQQKQNFYAEKRKSYYPQKISNNNYKYGPEEAENGFDQKKRSYGTNTNEDSSFDLEDDSEWNGVRFQPTNHGSQDRQKNFYPTNDEEDGTESFDLSREGYSTSRWWDPTSLDSESFGSREEKLQGTNKPEQWGMSDTRHQNGRLHYDLRTEKFSPNHPYNTIKNKNKMYPQKYRSQNDDWEDEVNEEGEP